MKKLSTIVIAGICALTITTSAYAATITSPDEADGTQIETVIPSRHQITVSSDEHGKILIDDKEISQTTDAGRLSNPVITFDVDDGYQIDKVIINAVDVTDQITDNTYTIDGIYEDTSIVVTYKEIDNSSDSSSDDSSENSSSTDSSEVTSQVDSSSSDSSDVTSQIDSSSSDSSDSTNSYDSSDSTSSTDSQTSGSSDSMTDSKDSTGTDSKNSVSTEKDKSSQKAENSLSDVSSSSPNTGIIGGVAIPVTLLCAAVVVLKKKKKD